MSDFNNAQSRRAFAVPKKALLTISDETSLTAEEVESSKVEFQDLQAQRQEIINAGKRITSASKERMEILLNLGRLTKDVEVEGIKFSLRSLKSKEIQSITKMAEQLDSQIDSYFASRNNVLSRAIYAIDDQSLGDVLDKADGGAVLKWLDEMDDAILEYLHDAYLEMVKKNKKRFEIKSEEQIKEVVEELKKS